MKRMETLAKHRQTSEAAVLQMNRKHVLGLQDEVQRIDKEKLMREKYLVFEKGLLYARLDKIQQRQISLGLIKAPISRATPHSVQRRLQSRRLIRMMRHRAAAAAAAAGGQAPGIFLTTGDASETKPVKGIILPPVEQRKNKETAEKAALNSSKYAPSWLELPDATSTKRKLSGSSLPKIEEQPEVQSPLSPHKKTPPSRGLPPIDIVHLVNTPIVTVEDGEGSPESRGAQEETRRLSGDGTAHETDTVNGGTSHPSAGREKGHELTNEEERGVVSDGAVHEEGENKNDGAIQSGRDQSTSENGEEQKDVNKKLRRLSLDKDNDKTNRSRSLDTTVTVEKTKSLRPQSAPGPHNDESSDQG